MSVCFYIFLSSFFIHVNGQDMKLVAGHVVSPLIRTVCRSKALLLLLLSVIPTRRSNTNLNVSDRSGERSRLAQRVGCHALSHTFSANCEFSYGQLTSTGIEQQHRLGQYIRTRYDSILSSTFTPREIVVRSTDYDRTLMSAQSNLVGLYPVMNISSDQVPIQPIPIHTIPTAEDFVRRTSIASHSNTRALFSYSA